VREDGKERERGRGGVLCFRVRYHVRDPILVLSDPRKRNKRGGNPRFDQRSLEKLCSNVLSKLTLESIQISATHQFRTQLGKERKRAYLVLDVARNLTLPPLLLRPLPISFQRFFFVHSRSQIPHPDQSIPTSRQQMRSFLRLRGRVRGGSRTDRGDGSLMKRESIDTLRSCWGRGNVDKR